MADVSNKIRKYIQDIASATIANKERTAELAANISKASRAKDAQIKSQKHHCPVQTHHYWHHCTSVKITGKQGE
jgi:hypothetical protein